MRLRYLSLRFLPDTEAIVEACCRTWNALTASRAVSVPMRLSLRLFDCGAIPKRGPSGQSFAVTHAEVITSPAKLVYFVDCQFVLA